jgi:hypothetical protein
VSATADASESERDGARALALELARSPAHGLAEASRAVALAAISGYYRRALHEHAPRQSPRDGQ